MRAVFCIPILLTVILSSATAKDSSRPPATVTVIEARRTPFSDRIEALGTLRANESVELAATVGERVVEIGFEDGQRVEAGRILVKLSSTEEEALLKETSSAALEAKKQYDRIAQLAERGTSSASQLDEARRVYETAKARQLAIESRLAELVIQAPFGGIVGLRNISVGAVVRPGDLITTLDDDSKMLLDFTIPAAFLGVVAPGTPIEATTATFAGKPFVGVVRSVSSRVDPATRSATVRAEIPNPDRLLKPGMLMKVNLLGHPREALAIPEGALLPDGRSNFVMVIENSPTGPVAKRRVVRSGARRQGEVEILDGLSEGEKIVTHGAFKLSDGTPVLILSENEPSPATRD